MEGLENCKLLEEINFEKNKISHIYGLENLIYLKKIELGKNKIICEVLEARPADVKGSDVAKKVSLYLAILKKIAKLLR